MLDNKHNRRNKLMSIFDMENDFLKHRKKIIAVSRKDVRQILKKQYHSQMQAINSFRKNWSNALAFRNFQREREITNNNKYLRDSILKQYNRQSSVTIDERSLINTPRSRSASRISFTANSDKKRAINQQNTRLMKKILNMESSLSKDKMETSYKKLKVTKQKLEIFNEKNRERLQKSLRKMRIEPIVYFPKMRSYQSAIK